MTFRYIGSKARLASALVAHFGKPTGAERRLVDVFCGTGAVAEAAAEAGWNVWVNDSLHSAATMATARLIPRSQVPFQGVGGYERALERLNDTAPIEGFLWREYSPASLSRCGVERRYFTEYNAAKLDAMRATIARWELAGDISSTERLVLVADMLSATNRAANIAGTYGCFLAKWQRQALDPVVLLPRSFAATARRIDTTVSDVFAIELKDTDVAYLDPPYTKRQYASYYHILETITLHDEPVVAGVCGLRPWKEKASPFCYKTRALRALVSLIKGLAANRVLLSYSNEGHVDLNELVDELKHSGDVCLIPLNDIGRYRPNVAASSNGDVVTEYLLVYQRHALPMRKVANS